MNKTFKVVFNRARGALMVANEVTSSVQKKGVKTIVAASVAGVLAVTSGFALALEHNTKINSLESQTISGDATFPDGFGGYLYVGGKDFTSSGNTYTVTATRADGNYAFGSAIAMYAKGDAGKSKYTGNFTNDKFVGNTLTASGKNTSKDGATWSAGGAILVKGYTVNFTDVLFKDNKVVSKVEELGTVAVGGAVMLDKTINNENSAATTANFIFNKDITYSGNTVATDNPSVTTTEYGGLAYTSGGFLFMDRCSTANFIVADGVTFTLGTLGNSDANADTIASSMTADSDANGTYGGHNLITKQGEGTFIVNSSLSGYNGEVKVQAGTMKVNSAWKIRNTVTITGGTLDLSESNFEFSSIKGCVEEFNKKVNKSFNVDSSAKGSIVLNGGTLQTKLTQVFGEKATLADKSFDDAITSLTLTSGTLALVDSGTYTSESLTALKAKTSGVTLSLVNATLASTETAKLVDGVIQGKTTVTAETTDGKATIGASSSSTDTAVTTGAQTIELDKAADVTVKAESNVTLVGKTDGSDFIKNATKVDVAAGATLNLGSAEVEKATSGTLPEVTLARSAVLNVVNAAVTTKSLTGGEGVKINLGTTEAAGVLHTEALSLKGAQIFLDPAWQNGSTISDASSLSAVTVSDLTGTIVAGQNSIVALGATKDAAVASFNKVAGENGLTWGESGVTAGLFLGKPIAATSSAILVNGALTSMDGVEVKNGIEIASKGILMIDQAGVGTETAVSGATVTIADDATVAVINAKGGTTLTLSDADEPVIVTTTLADETAPETLTVLTDNPFVKGTLTASTGTIALSDSADKTGIDAIASMGIQSMIRHADAVLAETIADRTVVRESGLWVNVRGERYEQDDVGSGFKADVGYGAFGADFAPTDATRLGLAVQYGHGKVKGNSYSVKNKFKDYSVTLYGSALLGETGINLLGEVAYTQSKNDITNSYYTGLNQDLDAKMYSAGVTAQKTFEVGSFDLTPSVGVRVSRIETDKMKAGSLSIAKQKQTLVQVPIAVRLSAKAIETASGWSVTPRAKVAYIPTFGDKKIELFGVKSTVMDTSPVQGALGVSFKKGAFTMDAAVQGGVGNRGTTSIGGKIGLSYAF